MRPVPGTIWWSPGTAPGGLGAGDAAGGGPGELAFLEFLGAGLGGCAGFVGGGVAEGAFFPAGGAPGGSDGAAGGVGAGGGGPVDLAALEVLVAAAVDQSAGLVAGGVAEGSGFPAGLAPGAVDHAAGGVGAGGGGPVDLALLEVLVAAAVGESADLAAGGVAEPALFPAAGGPRGADGAAGDVGAGGRGPVDLAALEVLVAAAV